MGGDIAAQSGARDEPRMGHQRVPAATGEGAGFHGGVVTQKRRGRAKRAWPTKKAWRGRH